ncbi:MAG TPA: hypothetical protein VHY37_05950 [Tepidisphaeraceae bacterium]|jgi:hypothetical protein|nr:hypothetical protein [Tepidisphaeraceae bacterium]
MASTYSTLVGAPPHPKTFAFRDWYSRLLGLRISYSAQARPTNYYFAQAGNDSTGSGTQASPYKTIAKANALVAAGSGNIGCFFNRGDTWTETAGLTDDGKPNVTFGAYGAAGAAKPVISGTSANQSTQDGVLISGDGSWIDGLHVTNWGTTSSSNYPVRVAMQGTNAGLVSNVDADTGNYHIFGHDAGGSPGVNGGISTFVGCTGGIMALTTGTVFVAYAYAGGQECIIDSCVATEGYSGGTGNGSGGFYSHTSTGSSSLIISNRLHALPGAKAVDFAVSFGAPPSASTPLQARCFEIDTYQEMASSNVVSVGISNCVRINGIYNVQPNGGGAGGSSRAINGSSYPSSACWDYNSIYIIDGSNVVRYSGNFGWFNTSNTGTAVFNWEHCAVLYQNWDYYVAMGFDYYATYNTGVSSCTDQCTTQNCLFVSDLVNSVAVGSPYGQRSYIGLAGSGGNGNGYFNIQSDAGWYTSAVGGEFANDAHAVNLADPPQVGILGASPTAVSQLYQASQSPADGVVLEYDVNWQPRNRAGQNVGPIEIVTANQLQAAQLVQIIANTENCCSGGSGSGAFAAAVNVTDGTNPIPGAAIRITGPQSAGAVSTNTAGVANFALNSGSITVTTTATGYAGSTSVHTIDNLGHWDSTGSAALPIALAPAGASVSPGAGQTTAYLTTRDGHGEPIGGVTLTFSLVDPQASADSFDQSTFTAASDQTGLLQVLLRQSSTYQARLPAGSWTTFTTGSASSFPLPEILGTYTD